MKIEVERNPFEEDQDPATPDLGAKLGDVWKAAGAGDQVELQKQVGTCIRMCATHQSPITNHQSPITNHH